MWKGDAGREMREGGKPRFKAESTISYVCNTVANIKLPSTLSYCICQGQPASLLEMHLVFFLHTRRVCDHTVENDFPNTDTDNS